MRKRRHVIKSLSGEYVLLENADAETMRAALTAVLDIDYKEYSNCSGREHARRCVYNALLVDVRNAAKYEEMQSYHGLFEERAQ